MTFSNSPTTTNKKQTVFKLIKNKCTYATLQLDSLTNKPVELNTSHIINSPDYSKRPCLYTSSFYNGNITLEAAIGLPVFFLSLLTIIYVMNVIYLQLSLQISLEETVRGISQAAYITSEFYDLTTDDQNSVSEENSSLTETLGTSLITVPFIESSFMTDSVKKILNNSYVVNKSNGVSFAGSSVDLNKDIMDIIISYEVTIPFLPENTISLKLSNRCYAKIYNGLDMSKTQSETSITLYYTSKGNVFHTNKYCRYLLNYSEIMSYNEARVKLDPQPCLLCTDNTSISELSETNAVIYLTSARDVYHISLDCQSFTGDVFRTERSAIEDVDICEECLKGK